MRNFDPDSEPTAADKLFDKVEKTIIEPWQRREIRRLTTKSPHWNVKLDFARKAMVKARRRPKTHGQRSTGRYIVIERMNLREKTGNKKEGSI